MRASVIRMFYRERTICCVECYTRFAEVSNLNAKRSALPNVFRECDINCIGLRDARGRARMRDANFPAAMNA